MAPTHRDSLARNIAETQALYSKFKYAASESNQAAIAAARESDVAVVIVGNDPTCGPDMGHDWHATVDGGGTLPCTVASDGREGRDRESLTLDVSTGQTISVPFTLKASDLAFGTRRSNMTGSRCVSVRPPPTYDCSRGSLFNPETIAELHIHTNPSANFWVSF